MPYKKKYTIDNAVHYPVEFLITLGLPKFLPRKLKIKINSPEIVLHNIRPSKIKLCNRIRMQVK